VGAVKLLHPQLANALDPLRAEPVALEDFRSSKKYSVLMQMALQAGDDPPLLRAEEVTEVAPDMEFEKGPPGLVFYNETAA